MDRAVSGFRPSRAVYWPNRTSIGYLRLSTVCSEPLDAGPPQWKCSWMVWYTPGRPPPLTAIPLPTCNTTTNTHKHVNTLHSGKHMYNCVCAAASIHQSGHRLWASSCQLGSYWSLPDVRSPVTRFASCGSPDWSESDAPQAAGDTTGTCLPTRTDLRVAERQTHQRGTRL